MARKLIGNLKHGLFFVVSAPSGAGKTTLVRRLTQEFDCIVESISYTTRKIRPNEEEGKDYHFISEEAFKNKVKQGAFLEYAKVFGNYYGTSEKDVERDLKKGKHVILVIDTQGAMQLKDKIDATFIFITPPSMEELKSRLNKREDHSNEERKVRLEWAKEEMKKAGLYDYAIINENFDNCYEILRAVVIAAEWKNIKN